ARLLPLVDRDANRDAPLALRSPGEVAHARPSALDGLAQALGLDNLGQRHAVGNTGIHELPALRIEEDHREPFLLRVVGAAGVLPEAREVRLVEVKRVAEHGERGFRAPEL